MAHRTSKIATSLLLAALLAAALIGARAAPALAAPPGIITDIQPRTVYNGASVSLVVTGAFADGPTVVLDGYGALDTAVTSPNAILTALIPAGVPAGTYTVTVLDSNGSVSCPNALTVNGPTGTPVPTGTPAPTHTPAPTAFSRPVLAVDSYGASSVTITPGQDLDFDMTLVNWGQSDASNIVLNFGGGDFVPRVTGGVRTLIPLAPGARGRTYQPLTATAGLAGKTVATLEVKVAYTDTGGKDYSDTFSLTFPVAKSGGSAATATGTPTATPSPRPQLLISQYSTEADTLQPGKRFTLSLTVQNTGGADAKRVTAILGGGSAGSGAGAGDGTPGAGTSGGVSGAGGSFENFAPLGSSNVQAVGDVSAGQSITLTQSLIVNATAKPGAYPLKFSFVYTDGRGVSYTDDQVITLLVYSPPFVEISFYRNLDPMFAGQPGVLPIQIVNVGRSSAVLGNMKVTGEAAQFTNNTNLVGALEPGGYFTLDAGAIPNAAGPMAITVVVDYLDDFNQSQVITRALSVDVMEAPMMKPGGGLPGEPGGAVTPLPPETWWEKLLRFLRGLFGLDSGRDTSTVFDLTEPGGGSELPPPVVVTVAPLEP